jgi:hypothetical protein
VGVVAVQADAAGMKIDERFLNPEVDADSDNSSSKVILGIHGSWGELDRAAVACLSLTT